MDLPKTVSRRLAAVAAACAVALAFGACQKVRTSENWYSKSTGDTEWERRLGDTVKQAGRELSDPDLDYTKHQFDKKVGDQKTYDTELSRFGKMTQKEKAYRTKEFAGADEYKYSDYHFLKRQNFDAETSSDQGQLFSEGTTESSAGRKRFFGQRKQARTKEFRESDLRAPTGDYYRTRNNQAERAPNIVKDPAAEDKASLTIDDVRSLLNGG